MSDFETELQRQLEAWAETCGGEQFKRLRTCSLDRIRGPASNDEAADDSGSLNGIQRHVQRMQALGRWKEAWVIRVEYMMAGLSEEERLARLNLLGLDISRATYYVYLRSAKTFLAGAVSANDASTGNDRQESA